MSFQKKISNQKLGDFSLKLSRFSNIESLLDAQETKAFRNLLEKDRLEKIHLLLLQLVLDFSIPCFLLGAVSEFIELVNQRKWVDSYTFSQFEFWLNHFSGLKKEENYLVRAKIMGRYIPREAYQVLFPIGMGKTYPGSHYVTAHGSPDLDTTVASFWGWVDAFSARVGSGLHLWNIPGGPPESQVEIDFLFSQLLGSGFFDHFAKTRSALALSAIDLVSSKKVLIKNVQDSKEKMDDDGGDAVLVDSQGCYIGDWREEDKEGVRKVTTLLHNCIRWFVSYFQRKLTSIFSQSKVTRHEVEALIEEAFSLLIQDADPAKEFSKRQKGKIDTYLTKVLEVQDGLGSSFLTLFNHMQQHNLKEFSNLLSLLKELVSDHIFDAKGQLIEDRPAIFQSVEKIMIALEDSIQSLRAYVDHLEIAFQVKKEVLPQKTPAISHRTEVEEMRSKIGESSHLTVTITDDQEKEHPIGVILASELFKSVLGTVSLRDFCNRDETKVPSYLEVISVVDHHKTVLQTSAAPLAFIADAQSANALVAELSFTINDQYGALASPAKQIEELLVKYKTENANPSLTRVIQRLLCKQNIFEKKASYFIDPSRECLEYLHYLYAILDDTDLLSKVSYRDVICVASLLNRLKSLSLQEEVEVIHFDDLPLDEHFVAKAAQRILQNEDMYSLYKKIYVCKEEAVEKSLLLSANKEPSAIFADTKVQNGCNRVGQSKLFAKSFPTYLTLQERICFSWYEEAKDYYEENPECDLHMHMISTIPSADDMHAGKEGVYSHKDELWIWIPSNEQAVGHLKNFLDAFKSSTAIVSAQDMEVEYLGENEKLLEQIFHESFRPVTKKTSSKDKKISAPIAILRYRAGLLNSRKAMISPYLPKLK